MTDKAKESPLSEKHAKGKELYRTFRDIRNKQDWNHSEYRMIARRFMPEDDVDDWTNLEGDGYIDLAEDKNVDLNQDEYFLKEFWRLVEHGFADHMDQEDVDVKRGFLACDGLIRLGDKAGDKPET